MNFITTITWLSILMLMSLFVAIYTSSKFLYLILTHFLHK